MTWEHPAEKELSESSTETAFLEENHRFPNEPVITAGSFNWDILRIYHEIKDSIRKCALSDDRNIASIAIDTWGVDYGFLDKNGKLIGNPYHYRDDRTAGVPELAFNTVSQDDLYGVTGTQTMNFNTIFSAYRRKSVTIRKFSI